MKNLISLFIGLSFLCHFSSLTAQCRCTVEQLKELTTNTDTLDPIVGLYSLSSHNVIIDATDEIRSNQSINLSCWIILPEGDHFKVCHTEFTSYEHFESKIFKLDDGRYLYKSTYNTNETVIAIIEFNQKGLKYSTQVPPKKYNEIYGLSKSDGSLKVWAFNWRKIDTSKDYIQIANELKTSKTPAKTKSKTLVLNSNQIARSLSKSEDIPGYEHLANLELKTLDIKSAYTIYPRVQTIVCSVDGKEIEIDIFEKSKSLISIRPLLINQMDKLNELSKYFKTGQVGSSKS